MITSTADGDMAGALEALKASNPEIRSVFLSSSQGRFLGSSQLSGLEKVQLAAISAASLAIANKVVSDLHLGVLNQVQVGANGGSLLMLNVGAKAVLTVLVESDTAPESVLSEARRVADRLRRFV